MAHEVEEQQAQIPTAKPIFTQIYSDVITHYYQRIANIYLAIFLGGWNNRVPGDPWPSQLVI